jgi:3-dehydroquinate dehydratase/shikimate dehydrogenase
MALSSRLVAVVVGPTLAAAREQIEMAQEYADLMEIRLDLLDPQALKKVKDLPRPKPVIFTFRRKSQGGGRDDLSEGERLALFEQLLVLKPEYCDLETDTELSFFDRIKNKYPEMKIIGSFHDLEKIPEKMESIFEKMQKPHISYYKIAVAAHSVNDAIYLLGFAKEHKNLTCVGIGPFGTCSRILAPLVGADFCYASIEEGADGLGRLDLKTLCEVYHFKSKARKNIYALLGDPVEKSIGHLFHNKSFPKDSIYIKLHLAIPELTRFFSVMRKLPFKGFSVTMPLKEQLDRYLTRIDSVAAVIGSVNTIVAEEAHLIGYNTDGIGAAEALLRHCKSIKGLNVVILGAGGSARAIAYELIERGASVVVLNRSIERAEALANAFGCKAGRMEELKDQKYDVLINTIPADLLFAPDLLIPKAMVMDIVYWEPETPLLKLAKERGCHCINGLEVFEEQALAQQKIWFRNH